MYSYGAPGQPPPARPPARSGRTLKIVLLVGAVVLLVCCVGGGIGAYFIYRGVDSAVAPARDAAAAFFDDVKAGNTDAAYGRLCTATHQQFSRERFREALAAKTVRSYRISGTNVVTANGTTRATVTGDLTYTDGSSENRSVPLLRESGQWKVCGAPY